MKRTLLSTLAVAASAAILAMAGPATAAGPYTLTVGGSSTGTPAFTGTTTSAGISFNTPLVAMSCTSATATGTLAPGTGVSGAAIASINATTWSGCIGPLGLPMTVSGSGSWKLNATGTATTGTSDNVAGNISGVTATVSQTGNPTACSFKVTGVVDGIFKEGTSQLQVTPPTAVGSLVISNVVGCYGLVANGDPADFNGTYNIASPGGAIRIS
ncbi:hypothetical protein [Nocardioides plantarum]|uniref:Secreted protein n=1 Tax=Nocardioides plantarum TaxID=29299 RepID=A0ABV5KD04_9ACTN|nr:hypothetical protein [Nocardioides plantarum]